MKLKRPQNYLTGTPQASILQMGVLSIIVLLFRIMVTGKVTFIFLIWNLVLALLPLLFSSLIISRMRKNKDNLPVNLILFFLWLITFPNAHYIITDFVHLKKRLGIPVWYDIATLFSFAATALFSGLYSLYQVHTFLQEKFSGIKSHLIICFVTGLSGFGIYLGRIERWNSWDIITNPLKLLTDCLVKIQNPDVLSLTLVFSMVIGITYIGFSGIIKIHHRTEE
jgi:uncharacterized membrane protein